MSGLIPLDDAATKGPSEDVSCVICEKPTRSHIVVIHGGEVHEIRSPPTDTPNIESGATSLLATICHSCFEAHGVPITDRTFDDFINAIHESLWAGEIIVPGSDGDQE